MYGITKLTLMVINKINLKILYWGLAILVAISFLGVAYAQVKKEPVLRLISRAPIEKKQWSKVEEISSENGKFKGVVTWIYGTESRVAEKFTLKDSMGNIVWETDSLRSSGGFAIANDGTVIASKHADPSPLVSLSFYDQKGNFIKSTHEFVNLGFFFSPDGNYYLINSKQDGLLAYNLKGELIKNYGLCDDFASSSGLKTIVVGDQSELRFYHNGKLIARRNLEGGGNTAGIRVFRPVQRQRTVMSSDGQYFALAGRKKLYLFETRKATKLWEIDADDNCSFASVDVSSLAEKVVSVTNVVSTEKPVRALYGYLCVYNRKGTKLATQRIDYPDDPHIRSVMPIVDISEDGKFITVNTKFDIYKFELE